mgnify:CR=1 FL=1
MKKIISILTLVLASLSASAQYYDFESGGIYYTIVSPTSVSVFGDNRIKYSGNVTVPDCVDYNGKTYKITRIGQRSFENNTGLTSITLGSLVEFIGINAFIGCSSLNTVTSMNPIPPQLAASSDKSPFEELEYKTLYVPKGSKSAYLNEKFWKSFGKILEIGDDTPDDKPGQGDTPNQGNEIKAIKLEFDGISMTIQLSQQPKIVMEYGYVVIKTSNKSITLSLPCRATFVDASGTTAIDDVVVRNNDETKPFSVFTLDGKKVATLKDRNELATLRKGIYIINGKKMIIK